MHRCLPNADKGLKKSKNELHCSRKLVRNGNDAPERPRNANNEPRNHSDDP